MADYTYHELMKMQNDAIRRAEDMQARARKTAGFDDEHHEHQKGASSAPQEPKRIPMPEGYLGKESKKEAPQNQHHQQTDFTEKLKMGFGDINIDSDKALLLSLIMLLSEEKADELLIMALIYMLG